MPIQNYGNPITELERRISAANNQLLDIRKRSSVALSALDYRDTILEKKVQRIEDFLSADVTRFRTLRVSALAAVTGTIGGWSITAADIRNAAGTVKLRGAGNLAFGATPPTAANVGTGVFIDNTGVYGLNANTQNFTLSATNGNITAIAGTIGGWTLSSTALSNAGGTVTIRGAGNLAFGATPPTDATTGTGLFIDSTGLYGLNANTQQFYVKATDGKGYFGAGNVVLDSTGITISNNTSLVITGTASGTTDIDAVASTIAVSGSGNIVGIKSTITGAVTGGTHRPFYGLLQLIGGSGGLVQEVAGSFGINTSHPNITEAIGVLGSITNAVGGTITDAYGMKAILGGSGGTITTGRALSIDISYGTNRRGLEILGPSASANYYAIYSSAAAQSVHAGNFRIGSTTAPTVALNVDGEVSVQPTIAGEATVGLNNLSANAAAATTISMSVPATSTTGDLKWNATITGTQAWSWGLDNSDSNAWVLSENASLGTSNRIKALGNLVEFLTTAKTTQYGVYIKGGTAAYGTNTDGVLIDGAYDTAGTNLAINFIHSATSGAGDAVLTLGTHPSGTGDPRVHYRISGTTSWSAGVDNSDSDSYVIAASGALGTTNRLRLTTAAPTAFTQTYSTAAHTITQTTMTDPAAYAAGANGYSTGAMASAIHAEVIALRANMIVTQNVLNGLIDDLQALGLVG